MFGYLDMCGFVEVRLHYFEQLIWLNNNILQIVIDMSVFQGTFKMCSEYCQDSEGTLLFYKLNR